MVKFKATISKFGSKGEKTGWTYIDVPAELANQLMPGNKKAFRVKGLLDNYAYEGLSLIPMGEGDFILAVNATMRKALRRNVGAILTVVMEVDTKPVTISAELLECLEDEPAAVEYFNKLPKSHQNYYSRWIESAKSAETKAKRIAQTVTACSRGQHYGEMMRSLKEDRDQLLK
jgi:hypothetical protein